ncbi:hypothetical protein EVAR_28676_1 [Eumeta japonica]|uniref:Uncharacterized protein n=1 Tax=Eumeta variegata TaxID=151549 RepID=A0A4C1V428_EUMVA|nr:hypothetical protein EVAR_28676_1 [Eumeta japonica]
MDYLSARDSACVDIECVASSFVENDLPVNSNVIPASSSDPDTVSDFDPDYAFDSTPSAFIPLPLSVTVSIFKKPITESEQIVFVTVHGGRGTSSDAVDGGLRSFVCRAECAKLLYRRDNLPAPSY